MALSMFKIKYKSLYNGKTNKKIGLIWRKIMAWEMEKISSL